MTTSTLVRRIQDLPGPRGLPVLGNLFDMRPRETVHRTIERWCEEHGPMFAFRIAGRPIVVLSDHERILDVLRDRPDGWRRSSKLRDISLEMGLKPGLFGSEGEAWRQQRRVVMAGLDPGRVRAYFPTLQRVVGRLEGRWRGAARAGRTLDLQAEWMRYTVDGVAGLAFGSDVNTLESDGVVIQQHLDRIFPALYRRAMSVVPWWRWLPRAEDRALDRSVAEVKRAIAAFIAQARERLAADPARREQPPNLLEAMIVAAEDGTRGIGDDNVSANVLTMLLAGEDTTANTLAWLLHLLQRHPAALERAVAEARRVTAGGQPLGPERLDELDYVDACIHETMRLKPVAPFTILEALRDTMVGDVLLPAGTMLWCAVRRDSLDDRFFARAQAFEPERWNGAAAPAGARRIAMPFGAGPRVCPGRYLALTEMKLALAMLFSRFDIVSVDTPDGAEAAERMSFTMVPVGLTMRLRERPDG